MKKTIGRFQYVDCTATSISCGDPVEQHAVLIRELTEFGEDEVLFGWSVSDLGDTEEEISMQITGEWTSSYEEDLQSVVIDGIPLVELWAHGEL